MRGELLNVWEYTYREIWTLLPRRRAFRLTSSPRCIGNSRVLSRSLSAWMPRSSPSAMRFNSAKPLIEHYRCLASRSHSQLRKSRSGRPVLPVHEDLQQRRSAAEECPAALIGDAASAKRLLAQCVLSDVADDPTRRAELRRHEHGTPSSTTRPRAGRHFDKFGLPHLLERSPLLDFSNRPSRFSMMSVAIHSPPRATATSTLRDPLIFSYEQIEQNPPLHIRKVGKVRTLN